MAVSDALPLEPSPSRQSFLALITVAQPANFQHNRAMLGRVIDDSTRFRGIFSGEGDFVILVIEVESTEIHQIWRGHGAIIDALNVLDFLLRFKTGVTQRRLKSELKAKFRSFSPPPL